MPGSVKSIIVGGGLRAGTPSTVGTVPQFNGSAPPDLLTDSIMRQVAGPALVVGAVDPAPGESEQFRTEGGAIFDFPNRADTTVIGRDATAGNDQQVAIGLRAGVGAVFPGAGSVAIGADARAGGVGVALGVAAVASATSGSTGGIAIGSSANAGATGVAIGGLATGAFSVGIATGSFGASGSDSICIGGLVSNARGVSAIALAGQVNLGADGCIVIGRGSVATGGASQMMLGHDINSSQFASNNNICLGNGATPFGSNVCMIGGGDGSSPTLINTIIVGRGDSHTAAHAIMLRCTNTTGTDAAAGDVTLIAPRGTGNVATGGEILFQTGAPGVSGTTQQAATTQFRILKSAGGAAAPNVRWDNVTSGAGVAAGTLTNAPSAGDPSFWLPVNILGNVRYIPCWT